jgi:hypothetical protein
MTTISNSNRGASFGRVLDAAECVEGGGRLNLDVAGAGACCPTCGDIRRCWLLTCGSVWSAATAKRSVWCLLQCRAGRAMTSRGEVVGAGAGRMRHAGWGRSLPMIMTHGRIPDHERPLTKQKPGASANWSGFPVWACQARFFRFA